MIFKITSILLVIIISFSSITLEKTTNVELMFVSGLLFSLAILVKKNNYYSFLIQLLMLASFHWFSELNWNHAIYLTLIVLFISEKPQLFRSILAVIISVFLYTFVRLSYSQENIYSYLIIGIDLISAIIIVVLLHYTFETKMQKEKVDQENNILVKHDRLTKLLNIESFYEQLDEMLTHKEPLTIFIIDCTDLKATNMEQGFQSGNNILIKVAECLKKMTPSDALVARYGGDEFAIAFHVNQFEEIITMKEKMVQNLLNELGIHMTCGYSFSLQDGSAKNELISIAEERLFEEKRKSWIKREEHMLRAEKLRLVGELAAGMAHEIRNPLTTIKGLLQISKNNNYKIDQWYDLIMGEIARMSELTAEFLQFSKPHVTNFKHQSLQECIDRVIHLMTPRALLSGHQIEFRSNSNTIYVHVDKDKIVQVLINLVQNGLDAMKSNGTITITLHNDEKYANVDIHDTGEGIPESEREEIFTPFYTTKESGTGLGLSICQKTIQDHGGEIKVLSIENVGTTFSIKLPLSNID